MMMMAPVFKAEDKLASQPASGLAHTHALLLLRAKPRRRGLFDLTPSFLSHPHTHIPHHRSLLPPPWYDKEKKTT